MGNNENERIEIVSHANGNWKWTYFSPKGSMICESKVYQSKAACVNGLVIARRGIAKAKAQILFNEAGALFEKNSNKIEVTEGDPVKKVEEIT